MLGQPTALRVHRLRERARLPQRQTALASGFDLHACFDGAPLVIEGTPVLVPTGIAIAAAPGLDVQIRPRSGLSVRGVMAVLGTLDADYRGEVFVTMYCLPGVGPYEVHDGDRIAQIVVARLAEVAWEAVAELDPTDRGVGGHGSTGRA
ncbi:MAG: dUTP diphosphatase [Dehalococcoidia bacterium]|nr:dUTP diphosphatase [Dehalococcoidia bacterium]